MDKTAHIRPFDPTDREYDAVADIAGQFPADELGDFEYQRGADVRAFDESFEGSGHVLKRYIAEADGVMLGYAHVFQVPWLREPRHFWAAIRVHPAHQRRGVGSQLYQQLCEELPRLDAAAMQIEVHETMPALATHALHRGFEEVFRSWPFYLDTRDFDLLRFQQGADRVAARGITISTLTNERARDPDCLARLYDLHTALTRDIPLPGYPHPAPPLAWFEDYACESPLSLPEAFFIAKDGERYVGESCLHRAEHEPDALNQKVTGVRQEYRGYGIAVALKLETIAYAQQHGYARIWTAVESNNPSMLAINQKLGFVQQPGLILFEKALRGDP
jgi:mycothiol synthase